MPTQYSLIVTSLFASIVVGLGIFFYVKRHPKNINFLALLLILSFLPVISIFRPGSYQSGDMSAHVTFAISFFKALIDGSIIPRWGMDLNYTFGYPSFLFIYLLPYYLISFLHAVGFPFLLGTKLIYALGFILSGVTMYFFAKKELGKLGGFIAAIFYLFAPYHLVDLHFRADIGEIVAFVFLPLLLLAIKNLFEKQTFFRWLFVSISFAFLILSHPAISVGSIPIIVTYIGYLFYFEKQNKLKTILSIASSLGIGVLLCTFYWFPLLEEIRFTSSSQYHFQILFPNFLEFIYSPWLGGFLFQGHKGELSYIIGYVQLLVIIFSPFVLFKKLLSKKQNIFILLMLTLFIVYFFLMQQISKPLWYIIPFIKNFQFSYRFLGPIMLFASLIAGALLSLIKTKKLLAIILVFVILSTILNWGNRKNVQELNEEFLIANVARSNINFAVMGQAIPKWADDQIHRPWLTSFPKNHLEIVAGNATITQLQRTTTQHKYLVNAQTPVMLLENTWYFPGWRILDNNKLVKTQVTTGNKPGIMQFSLSTGTHIISVTFSDTWDRKLGNAISLITLISITFSALWVFTSQKLLLYLRKRN